MASRTRFLRRSLTFWLAVATALTTAGALATPSAAAPAASTRVVAQVSLAARPTIRYGDKGANVTYLQQRLTALHYDVGTVDGDFGSNTLHGVYAFQKVQKITIDGVVGPVTWSKLASPYRPTAKYRHSAAAVEVNLTRRVVYLTRNGAVTRIMDSSPGKAATPTPRGNFTIYRRINGWRQSSLGLLWRPNYFYKGYALHGSTSVPTYAASHGCVRLTVPAMNRAWSQLFIGEHVHVYR
ncbi:L,D-transpeptidase family protein [Actinoplanes sp. NPDC049316]|uniref:L,D-transpeptidase family protein n=1 Tax=Actinoplanes sp. NPDC049316 TaxID=3154727 RepID=UPI003421E258